VMTYFLNFFKIMSFLNKVKTNSGWNKAENNSGNNWPPGNRLLSEEFCYQCSNQDCLSDM
ncbi:MAG: hypothetical protein ACE5IR_15435, partial [bacterium]